MPDICQVFFNDDISVEELKANIDFNAKQYTDSVFKYADKDQAAKQDAHVFWSVLQFLDHQ